MSQQQYMDDARFQELLQQFNPQLLSPEQMAIFNERANVEPSSIPSEIDITNYKYIDIQKRLKMINNYNISSQSIEFFKKKLSENIKNIIILGFIQSGKTAEIIGIIHFCIIYLKIPIIILIQNKTSGYEQLDCRIKEFVHELQDYDIKVNYVKNQITKPKSKKIFNFDNPKPEVIISLCNYKQLQKIEDNLNNVIAHHSQKKIAPYVLIMDEYDDHIKSRQDNEQHQKTVEKSIKTLRKESYINVGVTATLLGPMLTDNNTKVEDVFQLKPKDNYVGFGNNRIKVIDITDKITELNHKRILHISKITELLQQIENTIDYDSDNYKTYSITLINTTDETKKHNEISEEIKNEFPEWACIIFNSSGEEGIKCHLPDNDYSLIPIEEGDFPNMYNSKKIFTITENKMKIPVRHELYKFVSKDKHYISRHTIVYNNYSISEIITHLLNYTDKIAIVSGRMACRGISFVTTDYKKHITDMIYVPSGSSHLTRNVQDMRIYGNFPNDNIDINLYTDKDNYVKNIGGYIHLQNKLLNGEICDDDVNQSELDTNDSYSLRQHIMNYEFDPNEVPEKKLDRLGLINGIQIRPEDKWGIPTNIKKYDSCISELRKRYSDYEIITYSKYLEIDISDIMTNEIKGKFIAPTKINSLTNLYKNLFINNFHEKINQQFKILDTSKLTIWYILPTFRNAWPLHNPLLKMRKSIDLCYLSNEGSNKIGLVIKNPALNQDNLSQYLNKKVILLFYSKNCFHYTKFDKESYYIHDSQ